MIEPIFSSFPNIVNGFKLVPTSEVILFDFFFFNLDWFRDDFWLFGSGIYHFNIVF